MDQRTLSNLRWLSLIFLQLALLIEFLFTVWTIWRLLFIIGNEYFIKWVLILLLNTKSNLLNLWSFENRWLFFLFFQLNDGIVTIYFIFYNERRLNIEQLCWLRLTITFWILPFSMGTMNIFPYTSLDWRIGAMI